MPQLKNILISTFEAAVICSSALGQELKPGHMIWEFRTESYVASSPAIGADGTVYVGSKDHKVHALGGKTGAKKWHFLTGDSVRSSPAIGSDGTVYVGSRDNKVYALDGKTRAKQWEFRTGADVDSSPAIGADGTVYVGSRDHTVYAFKTSSSGPADSPWPMFGQNAQRKARAPSPVADKIKINAVSKTASPFTISFESKSGSTYLIEASHDLKKWGEIGEAQGTGSSVEFTDWREALFQKQYFRVKLVE
ncbi:MAG: PQQ-binding-like beta-propeller repeat protein [Nitrospinaceae bacterium]|nr:PQQ-binding-like beta-propeller repeat protein [Nitrospinaceae bacterium]